MLIFILSEMCTLLSSKINFYRVLVMSGGEIVEFDDPGELMQKQESKFYKLAHGLA